MLCVAIGLNQGLVLVKKIQGLLVFLIFAAAIVHQ